MAGAAMAARRGEGGAMSIFYAFGAVLFALLFAVFVAGGLAEWLEG